MFLRVHGARDKVAGAIGVAVAVVMVLAGCSIGTTTASLPQGTPDLAVTHTPRHTAAGACHQMDWKVFDATTAPTTEVDCRAPHTTKTVYVGNYPKKLAAKRSRFNAMPITRWAVARCASRVASYLGTDPGTLSTSLFSQTVFFANQSQFIRGQHWYRCDVALPEMAAKNLLPLPGHVQNILRNGVPARYVGCVDIKDFAHPPSPIPSTVSCTEPHTGRPVGLVRLGGPHDTYPSDNVVRARAARGCIRAVRRWMRGTHTPEAGAAYLAPNKQIWDLLGFRAVHCYVKTPS